ncbi:hypothetical protein BH18ACT4_BH18ACT4_11190 [soil metagenome]
MDENEDGCCSLGPAALAERAREWNSIDGSLIGRQRTATGALLRYRLEPGVADALLELLEAERECCPDLSFTATVALSVDAPDRLRPWVADTFAPSGATGSPDPAPVGDEIVDAVRDHYAAAARRIATGTGACTASCEAHEAGIGKGVYDADALEGVADEVSSSSIGCANPVAVAQLGQGETVLELGSGGGLDVLLAARRVGPTGKV